MSSEPLAMLVSEVPIVAGVPATTLSEIGSALADTHRLSPPALSYRRTIMKLSNSQIEASRVA